MSDSWKTPITSTPAAAPMCPVCGKPDLAFHGEDCPWSWRSRYVVERMSEIDTPEYREESLLVREAKDL